MSEPKKISNQVLLWLVLVLALVLRLPLLSGSLWLDEAAQALESARPLSQQLQIRDDFQPPLLHLLLHFAMMIGDSEWWLRFVGAVIPGLFTIYYTYKAGVLISTKKVALAASILLATSSFHVFYSQELRQYSLPAAFAAASWYMLLLHQKEKTLPSLGSGALFAFLQAAGLYSSYLYPFAILGQVVWLLTIAKKKAVRWLGAYAAAALLFLPWFPSFLDQLSAGTELRANLPGWETVVSPTQIKSLPLVITKFIFGVADVEVTLIFILVSALFLWLVCAALPKKKLSRVELSTILPLLSWLLVPILTAWFISFAVPVLQPKRVLFCLPAFYLLIAQLSYQAKPFLAKLGAQVALPPLILLILSINVVTTLQYWSTPALQRENWRQLITELEHKYPESAVAVFSFPEPFAPWRWYTSGSITAVATEQLLLDTETTLATLKKSLQYDYIITFDYLRDLSDPEHLLNLHLISYGYKEIEVIDYPLIGFVRIYSKPEAVISYN